MRVPRESFLSALQSVSPGLATREEIHQSSFVCFTDDGFMVTFDGEISAKRESPVELRGAVQGRKLMDLITKLPEDMIDVSQEANLMIILTKGRKKSEVRMESKIHLPIGLIPDPEWWKPLPPEFGEAISVVHSCASKEEEPFVLCCIHLHPEYVEACDRRQLARYSLTLPIDTEMIVPAASLKKIVGYGLTEFSVSKMWMHFRNQAGLVLSVRRYLEEYKNMDEFFNIGATTPVTWPGGFKEILNRMQIATADDVEDVVDVELKPNYMLVEASGPTISHKECPPVEYSGPEFRFRMAPKLLTKISEMKQECGITEKRLFIDGGKFKYVSSTLAPTPAEGKKSKSKGKPAPEPETAPVGAVASDFNPDEVPF